MAKPDPANDEDDGDNTARRTCWGERRREPTIGLSSSSPSYIAGLLSATTRSGTEVRVGLGGSSRGRLSATGPCGARRGCCCWGGEKRIRSWPRSCERLGLTADGVANWDSGRPLVCCRLRRRLCAMTSGTRSRTTLSSSVGTSRETEVAVGGALGVGPGGHGRQKGRQTRIKRGGGRRRRRRTDRT